MRCPNCSEEIPDAPTICEYCGITIFSDGSSSIDIYDEEGFDSMGFNRKGRHRDTGTPVDKEGYTRKGYNRLGFYRNGVHKLTGTSRDLRGFTKKGFNKKGIHIDTFTNYDKEGYNNRGYDKEGYNRKGFNKEGFDINGHNKRGFNRRGFNIEGIHGETSSDYDPEGYDKEGYNNKGFDREGYDRKGYDKNGFDRRGINEKGELSNNYQKNSKDYGLGPFSFEEFIDGELYFYSQHLEDCEFEKLRNGEEDVFNSEEKYYEYFSNKMDAYLNEDFGPSGYTIRGFDKEGINKYTLSKYDPSGYDFDGYDSRGYNRDGFDRHGYDVYGFDKKRIHKVTGEYYDTKGFDMDGYDKEGYNRNGYNRGGYYRDGYDREGFGIDGFDQEGFDRLGYDKEGYDRDGFDKEGLHKLAKYQDNSKSNHRSQVMGPKVEFGKWCTLDGHNVRSNHEARIDDFLYDNNIIHVYEKQIPGTTFKCDWFIPKSKNCVDKDIWIEYWGMEDTLDHQKRIEYNDKKEIKRELYINKGLYLIEIFPQDLKNLTETLTLKLREAGFKI